MNKNLVTGITLVLALTLSSCSKKTETADAGGKRKIVIGFLGNVGGAPIRDGGSRGQDPLEEVRIQRDRADRTHRQHLSQKVTSSVHKPSANP